MFGWVVCIKFAFCGTLRASYKWNAEVRCSVPHSPSADFTDYYLAVKGGGAVQSKSHLTNTKLLHNYSHLHKDKVARLGIVFLYI